MLKFLLIVLLTCACDLFADELTVQRILKTGLKIENVENDLYFVGLKTRKLVVGRDFIIVRVVSKTRFDLLAQAKVVGNQGRVAYLELLGEQMYKTPLKGDYAIPIGSGIDLDDKEGTQDDNLLAKEDVEDEEPGYIQLGYSFNAGEYLTESSSQANDAKIVKYNYFHFNFKWYLEFFWRLGFEYNYSSDKVPTATYFRNEFDSERSITDIKLYYKLKKWDNTNFRNIFIFNMITDEFSTENDDEHLLSSTYDLLGAGLKLNYEWTPDLIERTGFHLLLNKAYLGFIYFPIVDVTDLETSRGTSSESQFSYSYFAGLEASIYWDKIPYIKQWFLSLEYQTTVYDVKFSGDVRSAPDGFYPMPIGTETTEQQDTFKIMFGFRIQDYIGQFFKPR